MAHTCNRVLDVYCAKRHHAGKRKKFLEHLQDSCVVGYQGFWGLDAGDWTPQAELQPVEKAVEPQDAVNIVGDSSGIRHRAPEAAPLATPAASVLLAPSSQSTVRAAASIDASSQADSAYLPTSSPATDRRPTEPQTDTDEAPSSPAVRPDRATQAVLTAAAAAHRLARATTPVSTGELTFSKKAASLIVLLATDLPHAVAATVRRSGRAAASAAPGVPQPGRGRGRGR